MQSCLSVLDGIPLAIEIAASQARTTSLGTARRGAATSAAVDPAQLA